MIDNKRRLKLFIKGVIKRVIRIICPSYYGRIAVFWRRFSLFKGHLKDIIIYGKLNGWDFYVFSKKKLIYLGNAKVSSSSIKSTLFPYKINSNEYIAHRLAWEEYARQEPDSFQMLPEINNDEYQDYFKFTFVRNPFSRLASCYEGKYIKAIKKGKKRLLFDDYLFGYMKKNEGFEVFARKVARLPDFISDQHFRSQYVLIYDKQSHCLVDYVGKFETLQEDFKPIKEKYELHDLPHINKTVKKNWMDFYNLETAELVRKRYAKDIEVFGYQNTYDELIDYLKYKETA